LPGKTLQEIYSTCARFQLLVVGPVRSGKVPAQAGHAVAIAERGGVAAAAEGEGATAAAALLERVCYAAACFAGTRLVAFESEGLLCQQRSIFSVFAP
jgi:hypothetical protein